MTCPKCQKPMKRYTKGEDVVYLCQPCGLAAARGNDAKGFFRTLEDEGKVRFLRRDEFLAKGGH